MVKEASIGSKKLADMVHASIVEAMKPEVDLPFDFEFRASRLPFCPRQLVVHARWPRDAMPIRSENYAFSFYTGVGTILHELIQTYLGIGKVLYGHWRCCGVTEFFTEGSSMCPVCARPRKYLEFEVDGELGAHVDGVSLYYNSVFEFKTTSSVNLVKLTKPYPNHITQASCYVVMLNKMLGINLDKICFVYLSRDNPKNFKVFVVKPDMSAHSAAVSQFRSAKLALVSGTVPDRTCENTYEGNAKGCPYVGVCFSPSMESQLVPVSSLTSHERI